MNALIKSVGLRRVPPAPDEYVTINGEEQGWSTLAVRDKFSLWMPESVIGFYAKPGSLKTGKLTITKGMDR